MELPAHFQVFLLNIDLSNDQKAEMSTAYATLRSKLQVEVLPLGKQEPLMLSLSRITIEVFGNHILPFLS